MPPFSHLTFCTSNKSNLYIAIFLVTVENYPDLYRLLIFHVPYLMSLYQPPSWRTTPCRLSATPQARGPPLVGFLRLRIQYICNYPPYWRLFLHLQPEDTTYHSDRDPLSMELEDLLPEIYQRTRKQLLSRSVSLKYIIY